MNKVNHLELRLNELETYEDKLINKYHENIDEGNVYAANMVDEELDQIKDRIMNLKNHIEDLKFNND